MAEIYKLPDDRDRPRRPPLNDLLRQAGLPEQHPEETVEETPTAEVEVVRHPHDDPPVLPAVVTSPLLRKEALRRAGRLSAHHSLRSPAYAARGLGRGLRRWSKWRRAEEYAGPWQAKPDNMEALRKVEYHRSVRTKISAGVIGGSGVSLIAAEAAMGAPGPISASVLAYIAAAWAGRKAETSTFELPREAQLSTDVLVNAFRQAGFFDEEATLRFVAPPMPLDGGWSAVFDLPGDLIADDVIAKRKKLAGALLVDEDQLSVERVRGAKGHASRVALWVAEDIPFERPRPVFPLLSASPASVWDGLPTGVTMRWKEIKSQILWTSFLVGAAPRKGKTFWLMLLLTLAGKDPHCRVIVFDGKPSAELKHAREFAHAHVWGKTEDHLRKFAEVLEAEETRRAEVQEYIAENDELFPHGKIRPLCHEPGGECDPMCHPTLIIMDEAHFALPDGPNDKHELKNRIADALRGLAQAGPSAGYIIVVSTQRLVSDAVPTSIMGLCTTRVAFKVTNPSESYFILGQKNSPVDASALQYVGVCYMLGMGDETDLADTGPQQVMTYDIDVSKFKTMAKIGRQLREQAGTLSGDAARCAPPELLAAIAVMEAANVTRMTRPELVRAIRAVNPAMSGLTDAKFAEAVDELVGGRVKWRNSEDLSRIERGYELGALVKAAKGLH